MSGSNGGRPPLHLIAGGRSADGSSRTTESEKSTAYLAELIARGVKARGFGDDHAEELRRTYLARVAEGTRTQPDTLDPLARHTERIEGERGGPTQPAADVFGSVLDAVPRVEPGALPSPIPPADSRPIADAASSPQAGHRARGGASRKRRDARRRKRREYDKERLAKVREEIFAPYGQEPDIPDLPALRPEVRGLNLKVMQDGTGRMACEVCAKLPLVQQMEIYRLGHAALPWVRAGKPTAFSRADLAASAGLPKGRDELAAALEVIRAEVAPTLWYRRIVCAAWGMWGHRGRPLSEAARKAARGGIYLIEGFCQNALSWLVPRADGKAWSRSVLWGPNGPFALLGAAARQLGRPVEGEAGVGLFTRWQQPAGVAKYKGPTRKNPKTGKTERFAVAQTRYDAPMAGRTALSLARRARGALRELARTVASVMTPWVTLPEPRSKKRPPRPGAPVEAPAAVDGGSPVQDARAPP